MRSAKLILGLILVTVAMSCSQALVRSDYDREVNFARYQTYDWQAVRDTDENADASGNSFFVKRLKKAVDYELKSNGYQKSTGSPDFLISWQLTVADKISIDSRPSYYPTFGYGHGYGFGYGHGYWQGYYGHGFRSGYYGFGGGGFYGRDALDVDEYKEGTLTLDFIDPNTEALVWRGIYKDQIDESGIIPEKTIQKAVEEMLRRFPPENAEARNMIASDGEPLDSRIAS